MISLIYIKMKKIGILLGLLPLAVLMLGWGFLTKDKVDFSRYYTHGLELFYDVPFEYVETETEIQIFPVIGKGFIGFKEALGFKESRGNYFIVNDFGYLGKYQFGKSTLRQLGITNHQEFLNSPELQEAALSVNLARNKWELRNYIKKYSEKRVHGIYVTESGILAAAHLAGPGSVKKFFNSGGEEVFTDGFGTSIRYYLRKFSGYDTSYIQPVKDAKLKS